MQELRLNPKQLPHIPLQQYAHVTGAWTTYDPAILQTLDPLHVWSPAFLEARLNWRPKQPITLLEFRCYSLPEPQLLQPKEEYWGCFSWINLQHADEAQRCRSALQAAVPALSDDEFARKQDLLRERLANISDATPLDINTN
eukprot:jgi/Chrzof1/5536/Cz16g06210.t1